MAKEAEETANRGEQGILYALTKRMTNSSMRKNVPVESKDGNKVTTELEQLERWKEHFEEVLNVPGPGEPVEQIEAEEMDINIDPPSLNEITRSIKSNIFCSSSHIQQDLEQRRNTKRLAEGYYSQITKERELRDVRKLERDNVSFSSGKSVLQGHH